VYKYTVFQKKLSLAISSVSVGQYLSPIQSETRRETEIGADSLVLTQ